jgi:hypothetical protein
MHASKVVQQAVYNAITTAEPTLDVYDEVPAGSALPYVVIGECSESRADVTTHLRTARDVNCMIHIWSQYAGMSEAKAIGLQIVEALDRGSLTVSGWTHVQTLFEFSQYFQDRDPSIRHGILRFMVKVQEG